MNLRTQQRTFNRNRMALDPSRPGTVNSAVISTIESTAADTIRLTFTTRVLASGLPQLYHAGAGGAETVASITKISDTVIELTFTGEVQGTDLVIEGGDLGIRTPAGGFVPAGTYAVPAFP